MMMMMLMICWQEELFPSPVSAVCMGLQVCSKGCVAAHFDHHGLPLCIANAHLEAGQGKVAKLLVYELRESRFHRTSVEWKGQQATLLVPISTSQITVPGGAWQITCPKLDGEIWWSWQDSWIAPRFLTFQCFQGPQWNVCQCPSVYPDAPETWVE